MAHTIYSKAGADTAIAAAVAAIPAGSGAYPVQQVTLTADLAYSLPVDAPTDQVIGVVFTQDGTGGHTVTYGGSPITVDTTAGASTLVEFFHDGTGWEARVLTTTTPDLSGYVPTSRTVNGKALTGDITIDATDVGAAPALGADDNYVTDSEKVKLANLSGTNTGDQDMTGYLTTAAAPELIRDTMGTALVAGANVTITPNDAGDSITIAAAGGGGSAAVPLGPAPSIPSLSLWHLAGWPIGNFSDLTLTLTRMLLVPLDVDTAAKASGIAIRVSTAAASAVVRVGLYAPSADGGPGGLVAGTEQVIDASTTGIKEATFTAVQLAAGRHWVALVGQGAVSAVRAYGGGLVAPGSTSSLLPTGALTSIGYRGTNSGGSLPASQELTSGSDAVAPLVAVKLEA